MTGIHEDSHVRQCIDDCLACQRECLQMAMGHCLEQGGPHAEKGHLTLMLNCADLCGTTAAFMLAGSTLHAEVCAVCARVCGACAQSCRQLDGMESCVQACERCMRSCNEVSGTHAPGTHSSTRTPDTGLRGGPPRQGM
jgi:hypothetical protein